MKKESVIGIIIALCLAALAIMFVVSTVEPSHIEAKEEMTSTIASVEKETVPMIETEPIAETEYTDSCTEEGLWARDMAIKAMKYLFSDETPSYQDAIDKLNIELVRMDNLYKVVKDKEVLYKDLSEGNEEVYKTICQLKEMLEERASIEELKEVVEKLKSL